MQAGPAFDDDVGDGGREVGEERGRGGDSDEDTKGRKEEGARVEGTADGEGGLIRIKWVLGGAADGFRRVGENQESRVGRGRSVRRWEEG